MEPHPLDYRQQEYKGPSLLEQATQVFIVAVGVIAGMFGSVCVTALCVPVFLEPGHTIAGSIAMALIPIIVFVAGGYAGGRAGIWCAARLGVAGPIKR
jgi:hypothetical protein